MTSLGNQLVAILNRKMPEAFKKGEVAMANMIADDMEANTLAGKAFGDDEYDPVYAPVTVFDRSALGLPTSPVTLRRTRSRIETTIVDHSKSRGATIRFGEGGRIFKEHHDGQTYGAKKSYPLPIRSIFPRSSKSVPEDIVEDVKMKMGEVLNGHY